MDRNMQIIQQTVDEYRQRLGWVAAVWLCCPFLVDCRLYNLTTSSERCGILFALKRSFTNVCNAWLVSKWYLISKMFERWIWCYLHNSTLYTSRSKNCKYPFKRRSTTAEWHIIWKVFCSVLSIVLAYIRVAVIKRSKEQWQAVSCLCI